MKNGKDNYLIPLYCQDTKKGKDSKQAKVLHQLLIILCLLIIVGLLFIVVIAAGRCISSTYAKSGQLSRSQ
jgi:hypothetical protein